VCKGGGGNAKGIKNTSDLLLLAREVAVVWAASNGVKIYLWLAVAREGGGSGANGVETA
jgi:hypothetical protein